MNTDKSGIVQELKEKHQKRLMRAQEQLENEYRQPHYEN